MLQTYSEKIITQINQNIFFKEFTFDKNDFVVAAGHKVELADNVLWLDELLIVIQIKEKEDKAGGTPIEKWFENKVLKKAKNQIRNTLQLLNTQHSIAIANGRGQQFEIRRSEIRQLRNIVIYHPTATPPESVYSHKSYSCRDGVFIHIFTSEDYSHLCRYLITPSELNDYLSFRQELLSASPEAGALPEQYLLAHFFQSPNDPTINPAHIATLPAICQAIEQDDTAGLSSLIASLHDTLKERGSMDYIHIVKEFAKLNRFELKAVKERLEAILRTPVTDLPISMKRCVSPRTGCGFVIMRLNPANEAHHFDALRNFTLAFKYKWRLGKCVGLIVKHINDYFDLDWFYAAGDWAYDPTLQRLTDLEAGIDNRPAVEYRPWYKDYYPTGK